MKKIIIVLVLILAIPALAGNPQLAKILHGKFNIFTYSDSDPKGKNLAGTILFNKGVGIITRASDKASTTFTYETLDNNILCILIKNQSRMCYNVAPGEDNIAIFHKTSILSNQEVDSIDSLERVK